MTTNVRISVPASAAVGDVIEIRTLINHPMETGFRRDSLGNAIARNILIRFECRYAGRVAFRTDFNPGVAANPYLSFHLRADRSGLLEFEWTSQDGSVVRKTRELEVA